MPQTLYGNQVGSETLRAGKALTVTVNAGSGATVERMRNGAAVAADSISATTVFGPFTEDMVLRVSVCKDATVTIGDEADQIVQRPTDAKVAVVDSLVSGDGIVRPSASTFAIVGDSLSGYCFGAVTITPPAPRARAVSSLCRRLRTVCRRAEPMPTTGPTRTASTSAA